MRRCIPPGQVGGAPAGNRLREGEQALMEVPILSAPMIPFCLAITAGCLLLGVCAGWAAGIYDLPLEDATTIDELRVPFGETVEQPLPAFPARPGRIVAIRFGAVAYCPRYGGCNYNMQMRINGSPVERRAPGGAERLIGRQPGFRLDTYPGNDFQVFSGPSLMLIYAPSAAVADPSTSDDLGGTFMLDVSDLVSGVDGNTLTVVNTRPVKPADYEGDLVVEKLEIGYLDRALIPETVVDVPERGDISRAITRDGITLRQGAAGGFAISSEGGPEMLVETAIGMKSDAESVLVADDTAPVDCPAKVSVEPFGPWGFRLTADWDGLRLTREVTIDAGIAKWEEEWSNTTDQIRALPVRHRVFLRDGQSIVTLAGDPDATGMAGLATNPTVCLQSQADPVFAYGVTAESDWLRLLMAARNTGGIAEVYSETLALPAKGRIDFDLTITPVTDGGGYWSFINSVRKRWGVNGTPVERPMFWGYSRAANCETDRERYEKSLGHLGPITVITGGWMRLSADVLPPRGGTYPKLPEDAPRSPGGCPDLDLDAYLKFEHRDAWWRDRAEEIETIKGVCPQVDIMHMTHPAMEVVYEPMAERFPIASETIRTPDGAPFEVRHYSTAHLYGAANKDWRVYYYTPRPGSEYLDALLGSLRRSMDQARSDGIYCDEFSWAGRTRGYSRYDYSRWDGYSADIDEDGKVVRLKSDNAYTSESCQLRMIHECLARNKPFLGNGGSALRSINALPIHRFIEGGNGHGAMAGGHLSAVPLVLGNMGDEKTRQGVFDAVKQCLGIGCIYSPTAVNLLLEGPDNFVCKLYPLTVREIGPGTVTGEQRLITLHSGEYNWPGRDAHVRLYEYNSAGELVSRDTVVSLTSAERLTATVPEKGLLIAEVEE